MNGPKKFQVKPEFVEAWQWSVRDYGGPIEDLWELGKEIAEWCGGEISRDEMPGQELKTYYWSINLETGEGHRNLLPGCYVYKDENGKFWVSQKSLFEIRFEMMR